jgi:hypothetical protein
MSYLHLKRFRMAVFSWQYYLGTIFSPVFTTFFRITADGNDRITAAGDRRITPEI